MFMKRRVKISGFTAAIAASLLLATSVLVDDAQVMATDVCASEAEAHDAVLPQAS
jgi:hypothetical protein